MNESRFIAWCSIALGLVVASPVSAAVHRLALEGPVDPIHAEYLIRGIDEAEAAGSNLVLLELDTPGGLVSSMEDIIGRMLKSRVPVCAYVHPAGGKAASAGFFLLMAADVAAMAPGTRTGAAHPVMSIGGIIPIGDDPTRSEPEAPKAPTKPADGSAPAPADNPVPKVPSPMDSTMMGKIKEDAQAFLRAIASHRGRNAALAETAVTDSKSWSDQEALENHLIDLVAGSEYELLERLHGREVRLIDGTSKVLSTRNEPIVSVEMTFRERALSVITDPNVAFLLLLIGALLVYIEVTHAGLVLPGVFGGICLVLAVAGMSFLPINATGVILLLAAVGLFIAEFAVGSFGLLALAGAICLALGGIMLVDIPEQEFRVDPHLAIGAAVAFGAIFLFLGTLAMRALRRRQVTGSEGMIGEQGVAIEDLAPTGKVFLRSEYWQATAQGNAIPKGTRVRCLRVRGLHLEVASVEPVADAPQPLP